MNIIKNTLTFQETLQFVNGIIDSVFSQDEQGNDIDYSPVTLQPLINSTFVEMYSDYVFTDNFDENFNVYMNVDIDEYIRLKKVNGIQFYGMLKAINEGVEYRKQRMLNSITNASNEALSYLITKLVQKEIANQDLQTKILKKTDEINSQYTKEELHHMTEVFSNVNQFANNPEYMKAVADAVHNDKTIKKIKTPADHKKATGKKKTNLKPVSGNNATTESVE